MNSSKVCSVCGTENPAYATECERCGSALRSDETLRTRDIWPDGVLQHRLSHVTTPPPGMIALFFIGRGKPLVIEARDEITLGRYVPGQISPAVDLTPHHAGLMGVSRRHAIITREGDVYFIQDVNSTNGTWVNQKRLIPHEPHPLASGDQIRLGQFVFYISFGEPEEE